MLHDGSVKRICSLKRLNMTKFVNKFNKEKATDAGSCRPNNLLNGHYKTITIYYLEKYFKIICILNLSMKLWNWPVTFHQTFNHRPHTVIFAIFRAFPFKNI